MYVIVISLAMLFCHGGLSTNNPVAIADTELTASQINSEPLLTMIVDQTRSPSHNFKLSSVIYVNISESAAKDIREQLPQHLLNNGNGLAFHWQWLGQ